MASSGYLLSPTKDPSKEILWAETWKRIDRFLPDLRGDLALEDGKNEDEKTDTSAASGVKGSQQLEGL
jgi:golgi-specific brefeldin A-resistance guanine nucleotide exchange factor 1